MAKRDLKIAIMHGTSNVYLKVEKLVADSGYTPVVLKEKYIGDTIFNHLRNVIWDDIHGVIVILSADDKVVGGKFRGRQNVVFELGYAFGAFDSMADDDAYPAIILLKEDSVEGFSDIDGLKFLQFTKNDIRPIKNQLTAALENIYENAKEYYPDNFKK